MFRPFHSRPDSDSDPYCQRNLALTFLYFLVYFLLGTRTSSLELPLPKPTFAAKVPEDGFPLRAGLKFGLRLFLLR
jgi:hypothetical protein